MPYKLYYHPNTASLSAHWVLVELESHGVEHSLQYIDFPSKEQKSSSYLSLNPKGRVPTLLLDPDDSDTAVTESSAVLLLLAELHPTARLAPVPGSPDRARFLEVYFFVANSLLPALRDWVYADKDGEAEGAKGVRDLAEKRIRESWAYLDTALEGREYLAGTEPSVADYLAAATVSWTEAVEVMALSGENGNVRRWCITMKGRESWKAVVKREDGWVVRAPPFEQEMGQQRDST